MRIQITTLCALLLCGGPALANGIYKWTDSSGVVHYTDTPPATSQTEKSGTVQELNTQGVVTRRHEALTAQKAAEMARQKEEEAKLTEQRRRDNALLKSFTKPSEVDLVRDRALDGIEGEIKTDQLRKQLLEKHIAEANQRVGNLTKAKRQPPDDLVQQIRRDQDEVKRVDEQIANRKQAEQAVKLKAAQDKQRLIELQSGN